MKKTRLPANAGAACAMTLFLLLGVHAAVAQPDLKGRRDFVTGERPVTVIAADFDQDGRLDLLVTDSLTNSVNRMKGFGDGTFRSLGLVTPGSVPQASAYADTNNDGVPDLITANYLSQDVTVNLGDGLGGFGLKLRTRVWEPPDPLITPSALAVGNWDADGVLDVAVVAANQDRLSILLGQGDGLFQLPQLITTDSSPIHIATADFTADGKADLAVANRNSDTVQIWAGDGAGGFTLDTTLLTDLGPIWLAVGDLNADTRPDIVVVNIFSDSVQVFLAAAGGGFNAPSFYQPGFGPRSAIVHDVDQDGDLDILVGLSYLSGSGDLAIMPGNGAGGFGTATVLQTGPFPDSLSVGDFDNDGDFDIATANLTGGTVSVHEAMPGGLFRAADAVILDVESFPRDVAVADFNGDGKPDVAVASEGTDEITVRQGDGLGGFPTQQLYPIGPQTSPEGLLAIDVDENGAIDLVTANNSDDTFSILMNTGSGFNLVNPNSTAIDVAGCSGPVGVRSGEMSGDAHLDVSFVCQESGHVCTMLGTGLAGGDAFGPATCIDIDPSEFFPLPSDVAVGNFNFDAFEDTAVPSPDFDQVQIAFSDGSGGVIDIPGSFLAGDHPEGIERGDINDDGYDDLVVANSYGDDMSVLLGDGGGAFTFPPIQIPAGQGAVDVALADFNLDGKLDAAVANSNANNISLLLGDGFGDFSKAADFGTRAVPSSLAVGDFNLDGRPDLVVGDNVGDSLTILLNQSVVGDPLAIATMFGTTRTVFRWGLVPGATYDVIRGDAASISQGLTFVDLGPVVCLADDLAVTDLADTPDTDVPPVDQAFFYMVRPVIIGTPGSYGESTDGFPRIVASGGCF